MIQQNEIIKIDVMWKLGLKNKLRNRKMDYILILYTYGIK